MSISHSSNVLTNINYESCIQCAKCHTNCVIETSLFKTESDKTNLEKENEWQEFSTICHTCTVNLQVQQLYIFEVDTICKSKLDCPECILNKKNSTKLFDSMNRFIDHVSLYENNNPNIGTLFFQYLMNHSLKQIYYICVEVNRKKIISICENTFSSAIIHFLCNSELIKSCRTKKEFHRKISIYILNRFLNILDSENTKTTKKKEKIEKEWKTGKASLILVNPPPLLDLIVKQDYSFDFYPKWNSMYPLSRHTIDYIYNMRQIDEFKILFSLNIMFDEIYIDLGSEDAKIIDDKCSICVNYFCDSGFDFFVKTSCNHLYCKPCFTDLLFHSCLLKNKRHEYCPLCKEEIKYISSFTI
jgi:hypothetical protein